MKARDYRKLRSLSGVKDSAELKEAYRQFLVEQYQKDIEKSQKDIEKQNKKLDKINEKIDKLYEKMGDIPPSEPQKGTTMNEYLNGEKGEKENQFEGYEIDKFKQNNSSDNPPDEELNYTDENGNHLNLRSGNYPENNEKPVSDNIKDIEEEINLIMDANTVKENSSANPQPAGNN